MKRTLITGFGPFGDVLNNPTERIVNHFSSARVPGHELTTAVLSVSFQRADEMIRGLLREGDFDAALLLGVARNVPNASGFRLDDAARNVDRARIPDCDDCSPYDVPIVTGGPSALRSMYDTGSMREALADQGFDVAQSDDAGGYVCNHTYYAALHEIAGSNLRTRCLFIHVLPDEFTFASPQESKPDAQHLAFITRVLKLL